MPSRRAALHAVGGVLLAGAGCLGTSPGGRTQRTDTTETTTTEPTKRTGSPQRTPVSLPSRDVDGATVAVGQPAVRRSFVYRPAMGTGGVVAGDDQYLLVAARGDEGAPDADAFAVEVDDERYPVAEFDLRGATPLTVHGRRGRYEPGRERPGWLGFSIPAPLSADGGRVRVERGGDEATWELSSGTVGALGDPLADFSLVSFETPDRVRRGGDAAVRLVVRNDADAAGVLRAAVSWPTTVADDDEATYVERVVDGASEATVDLSFRTRYTRADDGVVTVRVGGGVTASREVTVVGTATA